jgi:hypothetical protein
VLGAAVIASPLTSGLIDDEVLAAKSPTAEEPVVPDPAVELVLPDPAAVVLEPWSEAVVAVVEVPCRPMVVAVDVDVSCPLMVVVVSCAAVVVVSPAAVVVVSPAAVVVVSPAAVEVVLPAAVVVVSPAAVVVVFPCAVEVDSTEDEVVLACEVLVVESVDEEVVVDHACAGEPPEASSTPSGPITANAPATNTGVSLERTIPPRHTGQNGARFALAPRQASDASFALADLSFPAVPRPYRRKG